MRCMALIKRTAAHSKDAMDFEDAVATAEQSDACRMCEKTFFSTENTTGGIWNVPGAYFNSGKCQQCGHKTIRLGCALTCLLPIRCYACRNDICAGPDALTKLIEHLRNGGADPRPADNKICLDALDGLESMEHSLMVLVLHSYDMTLDELKELQRFIKDTGKPYSNIGRMIDGLLWVKSVVRAPSIKKLFGFLTDTWKLTIALQILGTVITPNLIARAGDEQILTLVCLFAMHKGIYADMSNALMKRVIELANTIKIVDFGDDSIEKFLTHLITSDNCAILKHLLGRHRFSHKFTDDKACSIIKRYARRGIYRDETFIPLLVYLANGFSGRSPTWDRAQILIACFSQYANSACNPAFYTILRALFKKCCTSAVSIENAVAEYEHNEKDFKLSENLFCANNGTCQPKVDFPRIISTVSGVRAVHIFRHVPNNWIHKKASIYFDAVKQAMEVESPQSFIHFEEMFTTLMNIT